MKWIILLVLILTVSTGCATSTVTCKIGEDCNKDVKALCEEEYIFSQQDCKCVYDGDGCKGLAKRICEQTNGCFSYSRGGSCTCPACEDLLIHQCLPGIMQSQ